MKANFHSNYQGYSTNQFSYSKKSQYKKKFYPNTKSNKGYFPSQQMNFKQNVQSLENHAHDLNCFQKCTTFDLTISSPSIRIPGMKTSSNSSKTTVYTQLPAFRNKIRKNFQMAENIIECLPIEMTQFQGDVFDKYVPKASLLLLFALNASNAEITKLNKVNLQNIFTLNLNGFCHEKKLFEDDVTFSIKGFDIAKKVTFAANEYAIKHGILTLPKSANETQFEIEAHIFSGDTLSVSVYFTTNAQTLKNIAYLFSKGKTFQYVLEEQVFKSDIKITGIKLNYPFPLSVFTQKKSTPEPNINIQSVSQVTIQDQRINQSSVNNMNQQEMNGLNQFQPFFTNWQNNNGQSFQQMSPYWYGIYAQINKMNYILSMMKQNQNYQNDLNQCPQREMVPAIPQRSENSSNFNLFLRCTTPYYVQKEELLVKDILDAFTRPALFGITIEFRLNQNSRTMVKYIPNLSKLFIQLQEGVEPYLSSNKTAYSDNSSALDSSFSSTSHNQDDRKSFAPSEGGINYICWNDSDSRIYNRESFVSVSRKILAENPVLNKLTLKQVKDGFFSVTYVPRLIPQPQKRGAMSYTSCKDFSILEVTYSFRAEEFSNKVVPLKIIGIKERSIVGNEIDSLGMEQFDNFWFRNQEIEQEKKTVYEQDMYLNKQLYMNLKCDANSVGNFN